MSIFDYTLPSGEAFTVRGPAGATQTQADQIFYEQVAAGSLVGYTAGQTLTGATTKVTKFELSRLDRGTAGVETVSVLAVIAGLPVVSGIPDLVNVPLENPVTQADIVATQGDTLGAEPVGILTDYQTQLLLSQISNLVDQPTNVITQDKGIGAYGFNCFQLEQAGYVKPGTSERFLTDPSQFEAVMNSPAIWTGKDGLYSLNQLLNDLNLQNRIQTILMQQAYNSLQAIGVISAPDTSSVNTSVGKIYTTSGLKVLNTNASVDSQRLQISSVADSRTLINGATNINTVDVVGARNQQVSNEIIKRAGTYTALGSKFGAKPAANWGTNQLGAIGNLPAFAIDAVIGITTIANLNINFNSIQKYLTNLVPPTLNQLNSSMDVAGKAYQYSLGLGESLGNLTDVNVRGLAGSALSGAQNIAGNALGQAQALASGAVGQAQALVAGAVGQIQGLTGNLTNFSSAFSGGGDLVSGTQIAAGFSNTVNRATVNSAVARIIGSPKIPQPQFEFPSPEVVANNLNILQAQNILNNIRGTGSAVLNTAQNLAGRTTAIVNSAVNIVT